MSAEQTANKNQPAIRFKGFSGEWCIANLESFCTIGDVDHRMPVSTSNGIPYIMTGDFIGINELDFKNSKLISEEDYLQLSKKIKPEYGDILFARYASIGDVRLVQTSDKFTVSYSCAIIKINNKTNDSKFLYYTFKSPQSQKQIELEINASSQKNIGIDSLKKLNIFLPQEKEQTQIGECFQRLDRLIAQHQQKHDKLKQIKKALLEKMFPQQGASQPQIRFKGFSGDWEEKAINELFTVTRGNVLAATETTEQKTSENNYPVYSSQTKNNGLMGFYNKFLFEDAITWTTDGANAGTVRYRSGRFYSTNVNGVLLSDKGYTNLAIAEILNNEAWKHVSHVGNPKLMNNVMSEIRINVPSSLKEQNKISVFLEKIYTLTNQQQAQLTKLNNVKQALLSKMFV